MAHRRLGFWRRAAVAVLKPLLWTLTRRQWYGAGRVPATGGVIVVANHVSQADPLVVAHFVYDAGRWPRFLAKHGVFEAPVVGRVLYRLGQIPVRRGTRDATQALDAAVAALREGGLVVIYPEGTTTHDPDLWPMRGKTGVARLWSETGAPVVPVASWGAQALHDPRRGGRRWRLKLRIPVTVAAGPPVDLSGYRDSGTDPGTMAAVTDTVMRRLRELVGEVRGEPPPRHRPEREKGRR